MHRIDNPFATPEKLFTNGDPMVPIPPTPVDDIWLNDLQENICRAVEEAGINLIKGDFSQLTAAIRRIASSPIVQVFDTPGVFTWHKPTAHRWARVRLCGGGGASGGTPATGAGQYVQSPAANGAGYAEKLIDISGISEVTVTVGDGADPLPYPTQSPTGETSSFGSFVAATGGGSSKSSSPVALGHFTSGVGAVAPGEGIDGDINIKGSHGHKSFVIDGTSSGSQLGTPHPGHNVFGPEGPGSGAWATVQIYPSSPALPGQKGKAGIVIVESW